MTKNLVLAHDKCVDGTTSAWIASIALGKENTEFRGVTYGQPEPEGTDDKDVYILDFCYPADILQSISVKANKLVVLDHHKTAQDYMAKAKWLFEDVSHVEIQFDMERSGAGLTNRYFDLADNWWVNYVEDRDLWRFKLPDSEAINAFIQSVPRTIEDYEATYKETTQAKAKILGEGSLRYLNMYVSEMKKQARYTSFAGYENIPIVNAPYVGISELVGALAQEAPFALGWYMGNDGQYLFSLRSRGEIDVAKLAEQYGGGGHAGASGFRTQVLPEWVTRATSSPQT